jgi:hypothetical protein
MKDKIKCYNCKAPATRVTLDDVDLCDKCSDAIARDMKAKDNEYPKPVSECLPLMPDDKVKLRNGKEIMIAAIAPSEAFPVKGEGSYSWRLNGTGCCTSSTCIPWDIVTVISRGAPPEQVDKEQRMRDNAGAMFDLLKRIAEYDSSYDKEIFKFIKEIEGE